MGPELGTGKEKATPIWVFPDRVLPNPSSGTWPWPPGSGCGCASTSDGHGRGQGSTGCLERERLEDEESKFQKGVGQKRWEAAPAGVEGIRESEGV